MSNGAKALWRAMAEQGLRQSELAVKLSTTTGTINRWLHGDRKPGRHWAAELLKEFGIDPLLWDEPLSGSIAALKKAV